MTSSSSLYGSVNQQNTQSTNSTSLYGGADTPIPTPAGDLVVRGDLIVLSGNILTTATTGNIFPANATTVNLGASATAVNIGADTGTTTINNNLVVDGDITAEGADFGNITIGVTDNNTIATTTGGLKLAPTDTNVGLIGTTTLYTDNTGTFNLLNSPTTIYAFDEATTLEIGASSGAGTTVVRNSFAVDGTQIGLAQGTIIAYSEANNRLNRPVVRSTTGNTSGFRVEAPNATTSASAVLSAFNTNDTDNGSFININARGNLTTPLRIQTGKYTSGVLGPSGTSLTFVDNITAYASLNPSGPTDPLDLTTKAYVDALPANVTYTIDSTAVTGGANLNLVGSDATTDSVKFAGGTNVTVTRTDANTITISAPDTNTTYTQNASATTGGANLNLVGSDATTDTIKFAQGTGISVSRTDANTITITNTAPDVNTTYTQNFSSTTGGTNLNLVGSDATTDTVKFADGTGVTVSYTDANTATVAIGQAVGTTDNVQFNGVTTNSLTTGTVNANGGVSFINTAPMGGTYATINPFGPFNTDDLTTVGYVNSVLPTVVTYTQDASATTGGANVNLVGSDATTDTIKYAGAGSVSVVATDANTVTITGTDTNTTYTIDASATTGGANLNLVGSDATTDTVKIASGTGVTVAQTSANELSVAIGQSVATTADVTFNTVTATTNITSPLLTLNTGAGATAPTAGQVIYDTDFGTTRHGLNADGTILDGMDLVALVVNANGSTILKGQVVYIFSATGNKASVKLASNTGDSTSATVLGIAKQDIAAGATGYITTQGVVDGLNLGAYTDGDKVYLGSTPGSITNVEPVAPEHLVFIGVVERANAGNGQIYVKPQNGYELGELHNVRITAPVNRDFLQYDSTTQLWENGPIRDASRLAGSLEATQDPTYVFPPPTITAVSSNNGFDIASTSALYAGPNGAGPQASVTNYTNDTWAGANASAQFNLKGANGYSAVSGVDPLTGTTMAGPTAANTTMALGAINFAGYATTGFANDICATNQSGGLSTLNTLQIQAIPRETFADAITTITPTAVSRSAPAIAGVTITGTKGQFSCTSTTLGIGQAVRFTGTWTGTGSISGYTGDNTYYIVKTNNTTTFTLSATMNGAPIDTTAGTTTGASITRNIVLFTIPAQLTAPYSSGAKVTVSGITGLADGVYIATSTTTQAIIGAVTTAVSLGGTPLLSIRNVTNGGTTFRVRGFNSATNMTIANRTNFISHDLGTATYKSDQFNFQGGTNTFNFLTANAAAVTAQGTLVVKDLAGTTTYMTVDAVKSQFTRPVGLAVYTAAALTAITGAAGYTASVSNSPIVGGRLAFWDTTNARWSYVSDNTAV